MRGPLQEPGEKEGQEEGAAAASGCPAGVREAKKGLDADSDSDQETEGAYWQGVGGRLGEGPLQSCTLLQEARPCPRLDCPWTSLCTLLAQY